VEVVLEEAECVAIQIVHFAASVAFEWRCTISAIAEQNISNKHRHATHFEIDRMRITPPMR
jgi:hypothetical protein